jgi:UDP-N-acetylmuramoylalanine--D-glutamate ligase
VKPISLEQLSLDSFDARPVAVLGLARSGVALTRFLAGRGAQVTVYDGRPASVLERELEQIADCAARLLLGPEIDPGDALVDQALVCTSPSINSRYPTTEPRLRAALADLEAAGRVPILSEVDLFLRLCPSLTVGVTGTKGKTTTSSLIAAVLSAGPNPTVLGGNIGTPLIEALPELTAAHRVVLELSELQLPTISRGTAVAVYTHVTSDHLDRHGSVEAYRAVKQRLAELLPADGRLVLNGEDPVSSSYGGLTGAEEVRYRRSAPGPAEVGVVDDWIVARGVERLTAIGGGTAMTGPGDRIMPLGEVQLPGAHNASNVLAAVAAGLLFGIAPDAIRTAVGGFTGVEHRLETVAIVGGVRFVNDSQGTQPDAVIAALRSFAPPIVLIAGGRSKNVPLDTLATEVARRAAAVVLIGESAAEMEAAFGAAGAGRIVRAGSMEQAVTDANRLARSLAIDGEATVLLSPAAASFDMFTDYAERGRAFKQAVAELER